MSATSNRYKRHEGSVEGTVFVWLTLGDCPMIGTGFYSGFFWNILRLLRGNLPDFDEGRAQALDYAHHDFGRNAVVIVVFAYDANDFLESAVGVRGRHPSIRLLHKYGLKPQPGDCPPVVVLTLPLLLHPAVYSDLY